MGLVGAILFNIRRNDLGDTSDCTLTKFVGDTKVEGEVDRPERRATTQKHVNQLEDWDKKICTMLNKDKCELLHPE